MGLDAVNQNVLGLTALIVSLVALLTTVLQVLQQYFSSAEGYRRCAESVMGLWSEGTHRKLVAREFRVEVVFETPVMFVAPPTNKNGPIPGREIHYIDGSTESYAKTRVLPPNAQIQADKEAVSRVHTADDERASWVTLLSILQRAENESRGWDGSEKEWTREDPEYQIAVGLQRKTRSWDFIPSSITKPYATSAICHLVEMMAMLGLYWKVFDQGIWNLRAEGNGFILTSTTVHGLGVMVVFAVTGKSTFKEARVIPCNEVKELAFGTVPNIFEDEKYLEKEKDSQSLQLVFGKIEEVTITLESLGCLSETIKRYERDHKHIFSVSFEIIGMIGKVFRIRNSRFRMLPNPTSDAWLKKSGPKASWKITRLMEVFHEKVTELINEEGYHANHPIVKMSKQWKAIAAMGCEDETDLKLDVLEEIHEVLNDQTTYLQSHKQADVLSVVVAHLTKVMEILSNPHSQLNNIVLANKEAPLLNQYFSDVRPEVIAAASNSINRPLTEEEKEKREERNTIWISLMFRMLLWFLLHDFDKSDVKMVPSDLKGSRMPVYIG